MPLTSTKDTNDSHIFLLQEKGYTDKQIHSLISNLSSRRKNTVERLLEWHDELIKEGFSHAQLVRIANGHRYHGISELYNFISSNYLVDLNIKYMITLNKQQLAELAIGGQSSLDTFAAFYLDGQHSLLENNGLFLTVDEVISIVKRDGGPYTLDAIFNLYNEPKHAELLSFFDKYKLLKIVNHKGGHLNLYVFTQFIWGLELDILVGKAAEKLLADYKERLAQYSPQRLKAECDIELTKQDVLNIVGHQGGAKSLLAVLDFYMNEYLGFKQSGLNISKEKIIKIVATNGSGPNKLNKQIEEWKYQIASRENSQLGKRLISERDDVVFNEQKNKRKRNERFENTVNGVNVKAFGSIFFPLTKPLTENDIAWLIRKPSL